MSEHDHIDGGFKQDLQILLSRRRIMGIGAASLLLSGCGVGLFGVGSEANASGKAADGTSCLKLPNETNGPFPADGTNSSAGVTVNVLTDAGIIRADMRASFGKFSDIALGVPLKLDVKLVNIKNSCAPLEGHFIYFWHCDAGGKYSIYERADSNNLRGAAITDAQGLAHITTIFPGCYAGRWPHIHFEVYQSPQSALSAKGNLLTSQFAMAKNDCDAVYAAHPAYSNSPANLAKLSIKSDGIFGDNTAEQIAAQTLTLTGNLDKGYGATGAIGIAV